MKTPGKDDKYYIMKSHGGFSPCIEGNNKYGLRPFDGSTLPNCVSWATGRFNALLAAGSCKYLGNTDAVNFLKFAKQQDLRLSDAPKKGACMIWGDGKGHVAIVEEVIASDQVKTSESGWGYTKGPVVREKIRKKGDGRWGEKKPFYGFLLPPDPEPDFIIYRVKAGDTLSKIAKKYNATINQIMKDNPIIKNKNLIKVNWNLKIRRESNGN